MNLCGNGVDSTNGHHVIETVKSLLLNYKYFAHTRTRNSIYIGLAFIMKFGILSRHISIRYLYYVYFYLTSIAIDLESKQLVCAIEHIVQIVFVSCTVRIFLCISNLLSSYPVVLQA